MIAAFHTSRYEKHEELAYFVRRGTDVDTARQWVALPPSEFVGVMGGADRVSYLPTPEEIRQGCDDIKSGRVVLSSQSDKRWSELRELKAATDAWELAGPIEDDRCEMPEWFGG